jgi:hypothetical protein
MLSSLSLHVSANLGRSQGNELGLEWPKRVAKKTFRDVLLYSVGHAVAQLVEVLRYKREGHGFDSRWCLWNMALGSTQHVTEMSTSNISWGVKVAGA